ncbi:MAG: hypothetical protein KF777_14850 [Planctomycetaceae bacterium]|nr:hypothetical protein [Planctomycetaceae bacterium]
MIEQYEDEPFQWKTLLDKPLQQLCTDGQILIGMGMLPIDRGKIFWYDIAARHWNHTEVPIQVNDMTVDGGVIYALHDGQSKISRTINWVHEWQVIDNSGNVSSIAASGGHLYLLKRPPQREIWRWLGGPLAWEKITASGNNVDIVADNDLLALLKDSNGPSEIWRWLGGPEAWEKITASGNNVQIAAGGGNLVLKKDNGEVWRWLGSPEAWEKIDNPGNAANITVSVSGIFQTKYNGEIWKWRSERAWDKIRAAGPLRKIAASGNCLFVSSTAS